MASSQFLLIRDSSVLTWRIPGTGEPGGLQSTGSHRVGHDWRHLAAAAAAGKAKNPGGYQFGRLQIGIQANGGSLKWDSEWKEADPS